MTTDVLTEIFPAVSAADIDAVAAGEPSWLSERRRAAWVAYDGLGYPDIYDEEWRRTDIRALDFSGLRAVAGAYGALQGDAPAGVVVTDLRTAARDHTDIVQKHLYSAIPASEWKFLALNAALWSDGCFIHVPANTEVALPITWLTRFAGTNAVFSPRMLLVAGANSRVTFIDDAESPDGERALVAGAVEIIAGDGAKVAYYNVNRLGDAALNFTTVRAILGRDAELTAFAAGIGSKLTKMRIDAEMPEAGARTEILGVTFGDGTQHFDYNTLQNHTGQHTISDLQFKSALTDSASLVWYGVTRINETAGGSEANQTSRNLLLSEHAKASPIPVLEIKAHDVSKCSHGATAGPVDENELFYLQARAIPRETAESMLVEGFFASVVDRIPDAALRARLMDIILTKAGGAAAGVLTYDEVLAG